jgi:hypothetical protein
VSWSVFGRVCFAWLLTMPLVGLGVVILEVAVVPPPWLAVVLLVGLLGTMAAFVA